MRKRNKRILFPKLDTDSIPIQELITVHDQFYRGKFVLSENLGDGFLYHLNPIFRAVRNQYRRLGYNFTTSNIGHYYSFSLMAIDEILAAGKIPYRKNFLWLQKLEKVAPRKFTLRDLQHGDLHYNYLFHESAHFIAHRIFFGRRKMDAVPKSSTSLWQILAGEAFANSVECLSYAYAEGEIATFFLDANCHFRASKKDLQILRQSLARLGVTNTFRVLFGAFLYANYMYAELGSSEFRRIREFAKIRSSEKIEALARIGLSLCDEFRMHTTRLHLMKIGYPADLAPFMKQDPLVWLKNKNSVLRNVERLLVIPINSN